MPQEKIHNKVILGGGLLVEAAKECVNASDDIGFAKSILLAGAVSLIITPLLNEKGIDSLHEAISKIGAEISGQNLSTLTPKQLNSVKGDGLRRFRFAYNSLKHTGNRNLKASDDLTFNANLKHEAFSLIGAVIDDYIVLLDFPEKYNPFPSTELHNLLNSRWNIPEK